MRRANLLAVLVLVLVAAAWVAVVIWGGSEPGFLRGSFDIYAAHYPNVIYALQSLRAGHGLLWNPFQNCGQPFLPSTLVGLLYPPHLLFLLVDPDTGFLLFGFIHLALAGVFAFFLCREYGLGTAGSLAGGLAFMLGGATLALAVWVPTTILGPFVWIPASLWATERILKAPSVTGAIGLGVCLTLGLLPGYPQITFFTYQLIALRVVWALATDRAARSLVTLGCVGLGLVIPVFLGAVYLFPSLEFAQQSVRGKALLLEEINPIKADTWKAFRASAGMMTNSFLPIFTLVPTALAALALTTRARWQVTAFYLLASALYMLLSFYGPLFDVYRSLPMGSTFREPMRFLWLETFTFSVLVALGVDRVAAVTEGSPRRMLLWTGAVVAGTLAFSSICQRPFGLREWTLLGLALATVAVAALRGRPMLAAAVLPVLVGVNLFTEGMHPFMVRIAHADELFYQHRDAFELLKQRMTPQDRVYQFGEHQDYSLTPKAASIFGVLSIVDYEPQTSRRFAELTVMLFLKMPMTSLNTFNFRLNPVPLSWPLFDLMAARYLMVDDRGNRFNIPLQPSLAPVWRDDHLRILENPSALPRAYFVPRLEVMEPGFVLARLASPAHDPRRVALVEEAPRDGFVGAGPGGSGEVTSLTDRAETVEIALRASADGFLVLTDQDYPGWEATVNGAPTPILRANHAFRTVRVPAGESRVVFRYRPRSVRYGVVSSLASLIAIATFLMVQRRRRAA
jgi:Bacterial membrane protein YfhO